MPGESRLYGVTLRGWIALLVIGTVCVMSMFKIVVVEPLYSLVLLTSGFYFGSKGSMMMKPDDTK